MDMHGRMVKADLDLTLFLGISRPRPSNIRCSDVTVIC